MNRAGDHDLTKKIAAAAPYFPEEDLPEILESIEEVLRSGWLILGRHTHDFEQAFRGYVGTEHAVAVNSCTSALQIILRYMDARGRDVIMPVNNFPGVVTAALAEGVKPVLAEMDAHSFCMDVDDAIDRVTPETAGMVVVHIAGRICPQIDRLREYCDSNELFLIEDASHAHGANVDGRKAGNLADAGCFSFYPTKTLTTGTGGMISTSDGELANFARSVRHHGQGSERSLFVRPGNDWCMGEIQAILGLQQLHRLDAFVDHRNDVVSRYRAALDGEDWLTIPDCPDGIRHAYYKFPVLLDQRLDAGRFREQLSTQYGVENGTIYDPPCHLQPALADLLDLGKGTYPVAESTLARQVCPPVHSALSFADVDRAIDALRSVARSMATG